MCNLAGYVGERDAAPILIEMAKRQEGLAGGYYAGIATIHDGKIYYEKLTGSVDRLVSLTKAASLPGKIGIIHTRSKSGGPDEWAHPFVGLNGDIPEVAYVAQGSTGIFKDRSSEYAKKAEALFNDGYTMLSRIAEYNPRYTKLSDGLTPHMSDVMCQLIYKHIKSGKEAYRAMGDAFLEMPTEVAGLLISIAESDSIAWTHINQPLYAGFASHGAYIANTSLGFPDDCDKDRKVDLHSCASGRLYADRVEILPFDDPPMAVDEIDDATRNAAVSFLRTRLFDNELALGDVTKAVREVIPEKSRIFAGHLSYDALQVLYEGGELEIIPRKVEGVKKEYDCVKFYMKLKV